MKPFNRSFAVVRVFPAVLLASSFSLHVVDEARAAGYPDRPIRMIVPFPPGGSNDVLGRYLGLKLTERVGQQVVIDNRAGANGIIGTDIASKATADGYTMLMISTSYVMNAAVRPNNPLPYDIEKSFDPISMIGSAPNSIVVHPKGPFRSVRDIVEQAKAKPGGINYAHTGVGGFNHFGGELFKNVTGIDMVSIPYKGGGPAMIDVIAGNIPIMFSSITQVLPHVRSGRLKVVAVGGTKRSPVVPDVPTVAESGYPDYELAVWWGLSTPAGAPRANLERLRRELTAILDEPETKKRLLADAAEPRLMAPDELRSLIQNERKKWTEIAKQAGIQVQ
jgi:tripartite-type tricarboxylate transporter receptor subunit TctC